MAYVVEADVDRFGYLHGGTESLAPLATAQHLWTTPFPTLPGELEFAWEQGTAKRLPDVIEHNRLRDFACGLATRARLDELAAGCLHLVAQGHYGEVRFDVLQATKVIDVVDVGRSIPYKHASDAISFPHIPPEREEDVEGSFFRVPNRGLSLMVFVADSLKDAIERAGIKGWRFEPALVPD